MKKISVLNLIFYLILTILSILFILPFLLILSAAFSKEQDLIQYGFSLIPKAIDLYAFKYLFSGSDRIFTGYKITFIVTITGTFLSLLITSMYAYPLSKRDLKGHRLFEVFTVFTMLFSGGMVPWFIICSQVLHLRDNIFAMILPYLINGFNVILLRNFFAGIPHAIIESADIDGAGEWTIFFRIALPLAVPGLATVGLFISLGYWNDWWLGLMLVNDEKLLPLQLLLRRIISNVQFMQTSQASKIMGAGKNILPAEGVKMATTLITIGPILFVYPFVQKYFIKGLTLGSVKG